MRTVFAAVIGIVLIGLTATTSLAIKNTSGSGKVSGRCTWLVRGQNPDKPRRMVTLARGSSTFATGENNGFMGVEGELFGLAGEPRGGAFFGGSITRTVALDTEEGPLLVDFPNGFSSLDIPWRRDPGDNGIRVSLSNRALVLTDTIGGRAGDFINFTAGAPSFTITDQFSLGKRRVRPVTEIGGTIIPTSIRTSGSLSVDRRTFNKYRGRAVLRYKGTVSGGPNDGASVRGVVSLKATGTRGSF